MGYIFRVRDENGDFVAIPTLVGPRGATGPQGEKGETGATGAAGAAFTYEDFTEEQLAALAEAAAALVEVPEENTPVTFATADWTEGSDGTYSLTIPESTHGKSGLFKCTLYHLVDGVYQTNTWAIIGTSVQSAGSGDVTLNASDAYDGAVIF